jgi:hypothetical protein
VIKYVLKTSKCLSAINHPPRFAELLESKTRNIRIGYAFGTPCGVG